MQKMFHLRDRMGVIKVQTSKNLGSLYVG